MKNAEQPEKLKESELYMPIKNYLETLGYDVKGEVKSCDITAIKNGELLVVELKTGFTLELVYQALSRQKLADSVYVAVPLQHKHIGSDRVKNIMYLCKRLEIGLIFVCYITSGKPQIEVAVHPASARAVRKSAAKKLAVITEHNGRSGSVNTGGVTRRKIITVYKELALAIAAILDKHGPLKVADIKKLGGPEKTGAIIGKNFYKWYEKAEDLGNRNNTYKITDAGKEAIEMYGDLIDA